MRLPFQAIAIASVLIVLLCSGACGKRNLRGWWRASEDGKTYLVIDDDNGGKCGSLIFDRQVWPHPIGERGQVEPGAHRLACPLEIEFNIEPATEYHFDYWGP